MKINARELREGVGKQIANNQTQKHYDFLLDLGFQIKPTYLLWCPKGRGLFQPSQMIPKFKLEPYRFSRLRDRSLRKELHTSKPLASITMNGSQNFKLNDHKNTTHTLALALLSHNLKSHTQVYLFA
jgi:hypothetical protein